jgi:hypothetical protein
METEVPCIRSMNVGQLTICAGLSRSAISNNLQSLGWVSLPLDALKICGRALSA